MFCSKCGSMLIEDALFCSECGQRVYSVESTPSGNPNGEKAVVAEETNDRENVLIDAVQQREVIVTLEDAGSREVIEPLKEENSEESVPVEDANNTAINRGTLSEEIGVYEKEVSFFDRTAEKDISMTLKSVGNEKVKIIKLVREWTGMTLKESVELVENVPALLKQNISRNEAEKIKAAFERAGAEVVFTDEDGGTDKIDIYNELCEKTMENGVKFCGKCGTTVDIERINKEAVQKVPEEELNNLNKEPKPNKAAKALDSFLEWHKRCLEKNKFFAIILIIAEVVLVLWLLFKTWVVLLGILIIVSFVLPFIKKNDFSDEDRQERKETVKELAKGIVKVIVGISIILIIVFNWNSISNIWRPGAVVRDSYFLNYSDKITIGEAFENVYSDCKWSTYKYDGNEYVRFNGNFVNDNGQNGYHQIDFLVIGDSATIDSWRVDGIDVSWAEALMLMSIYKRNGVSW